MNLILSENSIFPRLSHRNGRGEKYFDPTLKKFDSFKRILSCVAGAFLLGGCATVNRDYPRTPSIAFAHPETTTVGALFGEAADKHPGLSGFSLVEYGENGFLARLAMIDRGIGSSGEGMHLKKLSILIGATLFSIAGCGPQFVLPKTKDRPGTDRRKRVYAEWLL